MDPKILLEIFGYIGTAFVILSMMMSSVTKLRLLNITGSVISAIYSVISSAWPIAVMNIVLIIINTAHLINDFVTKRGEGYLSENRDQAISDER